MEPVRDVALLALLYREAYRNRWESIDSIATDQDVCPGELSWLSMLVAHTFTSHDWSVVRELNERADFVRRARQADPLRAEALLHAAPPDGHHCRKRWATAYADSERWDRVRVFMGVFEREGLTATRDDLEALAAQTWQTATGDSFSQYLNRWAAA
jgi:hypothetical protein